MVVKTPSQMAAEERKRNEETIKKKEEREHIIRQTIDNCFASSEFRGAVTFKGGCVTYNTDSTVLLSEEDQQVIVDYFFVRGWKAEYDIKRSYYGDKQRSGAHLFVIKPWEESK